MCRYCTAQNTYKYITVLNDFIYDCNNTIHRSMKMTPTEAISGITPKIETNKLQQKCKFKMGDYVRICKYKNI